jgi:hypothetical protein
LKMTICFSCPLRLFSVLHPGSGMAPRPSQSKHSEVRYRSGGTGTTRTPRDRTTTRTDGSTTNRRIVDSRRGAFPGPQTEDSDDDPREPTSAQPTRSRSNTASERSSQRDADNQKRKMSEAINYGLVSSFNKKARTE